MAGTTWAALNVTDGDQILKAIQGGLVYIAPHSAAAIAAITSGAGGVIQALPVEYKPLGKLAKAGGEFGRDIAVSDVNSWGFKEPSRRDIKSDVDTLKVIAQQTNIHTLAADLGVAESALVLDGTSGELILDKPDAIPTIYYRMLIIARDVRSGGEVYLARHYPKAQITARDAQKWGDDGDDPIQYGLTFTALFDDDEETAVRYFYGGPGWQDMTDGMDFA